MGGGLPSLNRWAFGTSRTQCFGAEHRNTRPFPWATATGGPLAQAGRVGPAVGVGLQVAALPQHPLQVAAEVVQRARGAPRPSAGPLQLNSRIAMPEGTVQTLQHPLWGIYCTRMDWCIKSRGQILRQEKRFTIKSPAPKRKNQPGAFWRGLHRPKQVCKSVLAGSRAWCRQDCQTGGVEKGWVGTNDCPKHSSLGGGPCHRSTY